MAVDTLCSTSVNLATAAGTTVNLWSAVLNLSPAIILDVVVRVPGAQTGAGQVVVLLDGNYATSVYFSGSNANYYRCGIISGPAPTLANSPNLTATIPTGMTGTLTFDIIGYRT